MAKKQLKNTKKIKKIPFKIQKTKKIPLDKFC